MFNEKEMVKNNKGKEEEIIELTTQELSEVTGGGWSAGFGISHSGRGNSMNLDLKFEW